MITDEVRPPRQRLPTMGTPTTAIFPHIRTERHARIWYLYTIAHFWMMRSRKKIMRHRFESGRELISQPNPINPSARRMDIPP